MSTIKDRKGPHQSFIQSWSLGMNDYEIAKSFGVDVDSLRAVKRDLNLENLDGYYQNPAPEAPQSK